MKKGSVSALMIVLLVSMVAVIGLIGPQSFTGLMTQDECKAYFQPLADKVNIESNACEKGFIVEANQRLSLTRDICNQQKSATQSECKNLPKTQRRACNNRAKVVDQACKKQFHLVFKSGSMTKNACKNLYNPQKVAVNLERGACKKGFTAEAVRDETLNKNVCKSKANSIKNHCASRSGDDKRECKDWGKVFVQACKKGFNLMRGSDSTAEPIEIWEGVPGDAGEVQAEEQVSIALLSFGNVNDQIITGEDTTLIYKITNIANYMILVNANPGGVYAKINNQELTDCVVIHSGTMMGTTSGTIMQPTEYLTVTCTFQPQDTGGLTFKTTTISVRNAVGANSVEKLHQQGGFKAIAPTVEVVETAPVEPVPVRIEVNALSHSFSHEPSDGVFVVEEANGVLVDWKNRGTEAIDTKEFTFKVLANGQELGFGLSVRRQALEGQTLAFSSFPLANPGQGIQTELTFFLFNNRLLPFDLTVQILKDGQVVTEKTTSFTGRFRAAREKCYGEGGSGGLAAMNTPDSCVAGVICILNPELSEQFRLVQGVCTAMVQDMVN